ncbi:MAG: threonylcarbamoyl-AMP synthase [Marinilabiliales bacterium]|nr:MAG: threonylcarbamoyl-AMP synthase [Marinilabiliales bacterium]
MLIKLYEENPSEKKIRSIVEILEKGGIIVYPTDSVYAIGCDINKQNAVERIAKLKGVKLEKANFSLLFYDLSQLSNYTSAVDNHVFKLMKKSLPGPFTFILGANNNVPKIFRSKKKTVGIRVPDNNIIREIIQTLGRPLVTTSVHDKDEVIEYTTDPELIYERYKDKVDAVIDGGYGNNEASTVVDCTDGGIEIIRQGIGVLEL